MIGFKKMFRKLFKILNQKDPNFFLFVLLELWFVYNTSHVFFLFVYLFVLFCFCFVFVCLFLFVCFCFYLFFVCLFFSFSTLVHKVNEA